MMNERDESGLVGVPCMWMRGGTSKGAYFLASDLPGNPEQRDRLLLSILGSPDERQIDGIGGADPLTSKVAVVAPSERSGVDLEYLFLQVFVDRAVVTDAQNCGNILAGVGQFAIERGLLNPENESAQINVYMVNSEQIARVTVATCRGTAVYSGDVAIDGVPGTSAAVLQNFPEAAGSNCGALLPTGNQQDLLCGVSVTLIDNGMPVVLLRASDFGIDGYETREQLDANDSLKSRLEEIRLQAGPLMNLGNVSEKSVPKMTLIAAPREAGSICTRTFIPHRCHASIGVLGAVSVATACALENSVTAGIAVIDPHLLEGSAATVSVEHPIGETSVVMQVSPEQTNIKIHQAAVVRTARKLFDGTVYAPNSG